MRPSYDRDSNMASNSFNPVRRCSNCWNRHNIMLWQQCIVLVAPLVQHVFVPCRGSRVWNRDGKNLTASGRSEFNILGVHLWLTRLSRHRINVLSGEVASSLSHLIRWRMRIETPQSGLVKGEFQQIRHLPNSGKFDDQVAKLIMNHSGRAARPMKSR